MSMICHATYPTTHFTVIQDHKTLSSELSQFGRPGVSPLCQIYDDAADLGMGIYNPRTGQTTYWYMADIDEERVLLYPTTESVRAHPGISGWRVVLFND